MAGAAFLIRQCALAGIVTAKGHVLQGVVIGSFALSAGAPVNGLSPASKSANHAKVGGG
jgi:hypothetical protein